VTVRASVDKTGRCFGKSSGEKGRDFSIFYGGRKGEKPFQVKERKIRENGKERDARSKKEPCQHSVTEKEERVVKAFSFAK